MNIKKTLADKPWILAVGVFLAACLWMLSGSFGERDDDSWTAPVAAPGSDEAIFRVQVQDQTAKAIARSVSIYGRTAPAREVNLSSETEGRVVEILARRGEPVSKGEPLVRLDLRDREARLEQAKASVREHQSSYEAQTSLKDDGYVSDTQLAETMAKLESARAELVRAELDLANMVIRAPFDGTLLERDVEVGDFVRSGDPIASFVDNTSIIVTGSVAEQDRGAMRIGDEAEAELVTGQVATGRVRYIAPVADEATRTFTVEMEVPNPNGELPAGVTAQMVLNGGEALAHKVSPSLLTLDSDGEVGLKVVNGANQVEFFRVKLVRSDADGIWVEGVPESVRIISVGQGYVSVGQEVNATEANPDTALAAEKLKPAEQLQ